MARIETARNRGQYPTGAPGVPISREHMLGLTAEHRAIADFADLGGAVSTILSKNAYEKYEEQKTQASFTEGKASWIQGNDEFLTGLRDDSDYESYLPKYDKFIPGLQKAILSLSKTDRARNGLKNFLKEKTANQRVQVSQIALAKETDYQRASTLNAVNVHVKDGDAAGAISALARGRDAGYLSAEETERRSQTVLQEADWNTGINILEANPTEFLKDIDDPDFLPSLDASLRSQLKRRSRTQMGLELAKQRAERDKEINAEQGKLMRLARSNLLTDKIIRESKLDEFGTGSKSTFYSIMDSLADAALKKKELPFKVSDPVVEARILEEIRDPRSDIKAKDISDLVSRGLSIDDADRLISRLDVYKGFWFGRADRFLKDQLGWSDTYTKFFHPEGAISYHAAMNQLFIDIEEKNLKDKDIYERAIETGIPFVVDYWENVLSLEKPQIERMTRLLRVKPKEKQAEVLDPEGIFK